MATEFRHDSFAQQQDSVHKRIEDTLAKLIAAVTGARVKEPPDPVETPTRSWSFPPSVTQAPMGVKPFTLPRLRLEPPRFDGENAPDWIRKIQEYYNHHYTPLDDRLYLTQYLFDHPASDWREYWEETNRGKSWDDFLLAVEQRFDPEFYKPNAVTASPRQFMGTGCTVRDQRKPNCITTYPVANQEPDQQPPPQRQEEVTGVGVGDVIVSIGVQFDQPSVSFGPELREGDSQNLMIESVADTVPINVDALDEGVILSCASQRVLDPLFIADHDYIVCLRCNVRIATDFRANTICEVCKQSEISSHGVDGKAASLSFESAQKDPKYAATPRLSFSNNMKRCLEQQTLRSVGDGDLFRFEQSLASDGRSIPPRNVVTCLDRSCSTRWRLPGSGNADSVSSFELPPQILLTDPEGTGNDPVESVVLTTDDSNALATSHVDPELSPNANYSNVISGALIHEGTCVVNSCTMLEVGKGMLDIEELSEQIDTLLIPPFLPLTLEVKIILLDLMGFKPMDVSYHGDSEWSCDILRFGGDNGVRIFDLGPFDVSKSIRYGTLEDLTAALSIGVNNEGEDRAGTTGIAVEAKIWCHFHSAYFFFPP